MKILEEKGYAVNRRISAGGQGEVYLVERNGQFFIAKIFSLMTDEAFKLFKHIQSIEAPNVPKIYDLYNYNDKTVLIRDYIDGHTLYDEIKTNKMLSFDRARYLILKICETLELFHNIEPNPIIYRDLKPENIMISNDDQVFLIDFGIARYHKNQSTRDTVLAGTKGYTAPEVMAGMQSDCRSDIYSVGLIFYEMLTGKNLLIPPYQIRPVKESNKLIPKWVDKVVKKSTDMNMVMRYRNIADFSKILKKATGKWSIKSKRVWFIAALIVVMVVSVFGYNLLNTNRNQDTLDQSVSESRVNENDDYDILVDLEFDNPDDLSMMQLVGENIDSGNIIDTELHALIDNGVYFLKYQSIMNNRFIPGSFYHFRLRPEDMDQNGVLFFLSIIPDGNINEAYNIPFNNREMIGSEIVNEYGFYWKDAQGVPVTVEHKWIDIILHLDESSQEIRYYVSDIGDVENISYGGIRVFEEWIGNEYSIELNIPFEYWEDIIGVESPTSQIEFIRYGVGSLSSYLGDHLPGYDNNREEVDRFTFEEIEFIPIEEFTEHIP